MLLIGLGYAIKFYRGRYLVGSFDEALGLAAHIAFVGAATLVVSILMTLAATAQRRRAHPPARAAVRRGWALRLPSAP